MCRVVGPGGHDQRGGTPGDVDSIPVGAEASACRGRGGSLSAGQFLYVARGELLVTPGGLGGREPLRVLGFMVEIGCGECANGVVGGGSVMAGAELERVRANKISSW